MTEETEAQQIARDLAAAVVHAALADGAALTLSPEVDELRAERQITCTNCSRRYTLYPEDAAVEKKVGVCCGNGGKCCGGYSLVTIDPLAKCRFWIR